jgi:hypothetical protein
MAVATTIDHVKMRKRQQERRRLPPHPGHAGEQRRGDDLDDEVPRADRDPHSRQRPRSSSQESTGTLSRAAMSVPQAGQADRFGSVTVCCRGHRWIGTFANEPCSLVRWVVVRVGVDSLQRDGRVAKVRLDRPFPGVLRWLRKTGMAMAARMPMMMTTTRSSMRVKPSSSFLDWIQVLSTERASCECV